MNKKYRCCVCHKIMKGLQEHTLASGSRAARQQFYLICKSSDTECRSANIFQALWVSNEYAAYLKSKNK